MKRLFLWCVLLILSSVSAYSQSIWKHFSRPDVGMVISLMNFKTEFDVDALPNQELVQEKNLLYLGSYAGVYLPVVELAYRLTVGIIPGGEMNILLPTGIDDRDFLDNGTAPILTFEFPEYVALKWNTDATWKLPSKFKVGAAVGVGYQYNLWVLTPGSGRITTSGFGAPAYMIELNFGRKRRYLFKIRYSAMFGTDREDVEHIGATSIRSTANQNKFTLIWTINY